MSSFTRWYRNNFGPLEHCCLAVLCFCMGLIAWQISSGSTVQTHEPKNQALTSSQLEQLEQQLTNEHKLRLAREQEEKLLKQLLLANDWIQKNWLELKEHRKFTLTTAASNSVPSQPEFELKYRNLSLQLEGEKIMVEVWYQQDLSPRYKVELSDPSTCSAIRALGEIPEQVTGQ